MLADEDLDAPVLRLGHAIGSGNDRLAFESSLAVWFRVDAGARMVVVLSVGPSRG